MKVFIPNSIFDGLVTNESLVDVVKKTLYASLVSEISKISVGKAKAYMAPDVLSSIKAEDSAYIIDESYFLLHSSIIQNVDEIAQYDTETKGKLFAIAALNLLNILEFPTLKYEILDVLENLDCGEEDIKKLIDIAESAAKASQQ